jgi:hypothetical protein
MILAILKFETTPEAGALLECIVLPPTKVRELEGQDMRETIQDKVNSWFVENRNPDNGEYPDFPDKDDGGSKVILNPPLPTIASLLEDSAGDGKGGKGDKGKGGDKKDAKVRGVSMNDGWW